MDILLGNVAGIPKVIYPPIRITNLHQTSENRNIVINNCVRTAI